MMFEKSQGSLIMASHKFEILVGHQIISVIEQIAKLRIDIFAEYPYLYDGCMSYETDYLSKFASTEQSFLVVMKDGNNIVGVLTALPLANEQLSVIRPFVNNIYPINSIFYFSDVIMYPNYRGNGYATKIFELAEKQVAQYCKYAYTTLSTVIRESNHIKRPSAYRPLDGMWQRLGYKPLATHIGIIDWKEHGEANATSKPLMFWIKSTNSADREWPRSISAKSKLQSYL